MESSWLSRRVKILKKKDENMEPTYSESGFKHQGTDCVYLVGKLKHSKLL